MDVVTTSLEALIQRVTNPQNTKPDIAAIEAFCVMLTKENQGINIASKLLAKQIQASNENEALQALLLLDTCMRRCGPSFHAEVGKFRFLNEMIKLVSPKYLGKMTPSPVQDKIIELLHSWTTEYPKETKIKEAYEMLKKQGVVKEDLVSSPNSAKENAKSSTSKASIFDDEEKSRLLQKLLQSKNPDDLHAANRLIRAMVKEDENRVMQVSNRVMQLKSVHNNVKLLSDMLDSFSFEESSTDDFELITELYEACERLKPTVIVLANELDCNEEMLSEVLAANDALGQVVEKYARIVLLGKSKNLAKSNLMNGPSLLDFSNPVDIPSSESNLTQVKGQVDEAAHDQTSVAANPKSDMEVLQDIFTSIGNSNSSTSVPDSPLLISDIDIMQPSIVSSKPNESDESPPPVDSKAKALDELNELGEILLKETLSSASINGFSDKNKNLTRVPMNSINKSTESQMRTEKSNNDAPADANKKIAVTDKWSNDESYKDLKQQLEQLKIGKSNDSFNNVTSNDVDEVKIESKSNWNSTDKWIDKESNELSKKQTEESVNSQLKCDASKDESDKNEENDDPLISISADTEIRSLADIHVTLENIKPGTTPPLNVIEEKNGITVVLHFAADSPRRDVSVIVVTTMSKNSKSLSNYLFQAVVSKKCKCRLQPPSGTDLPAHNPFLPPSAITQIMLIANPRKEPISLKFMLSYTMDDETITEMGEVDQLPVL